MWWDIRSIWWIIAIINCITTKRKDWSLVIRANLSTWIWQFRRSLLGKEEGWWNIVCHEGALETKDNGLESSEICNNWEKCSFIYKTSFHCWIEFCFLDKRQTIPDTWLLSRRRSRQTLIKWEKIEWVKSKTVFSRDSIGIRRSA